MAQIPMISLFTRLLRICAIIPLPASLLLLSLAPSPAKAGGWNQFSVCITQLEKYQVSGNDAAIACSDALIPKELSQCVSMIGLATPIKGNDSLRACYQVRRPIDLGNCVADIYNQFPSLANVDPETNSNETALLTLLNSCRASLQPGFYSQCVIASARQVSDITPVKAMDTCLAAQDFPRDLFPAYTEE
jgi:hypothetical protein